MDLTFNVLDIAISLKPLGLGTGFPGALPQTGFLQYIFHSTFWIDLCLWVSSLISGIDWIFMRFLVLLVLFLAVFAQNFTNSKATVETEEGEGSALLVSSSTWPLQTLPRSAPEDLCDAEPTPFERSEVFDLNPCSDDVETGSVEMSILRTPGVRQVGTMWRMLAVLGAMPRQFLCPSATTSSRPRLHGWMGTELGSAWTLARPSQIQKEDAKSETEAALAVSQALCRSGRGLQRQRQWKEGKRQGLRQRAVRATVYRMASAAVIATFHGIYHTEPFDLNQYDCYALDAFTPAFPEAQARQGRSGAPYLETPLQGDQKQTQSSGRHQEGGHSHGGSGPQSGCQDPWSIGRSIEHHAQEAEPDRRRMGSLQNAMGQLLGQSDPDVDVSSPTRREKQNLQRDVPKPCRI